MLAVKHGKAELVELLLDNGAAVNLQDADGSTALMCAVEHQLLNIVKLLVTKPECDVNIADNVSKFMSRSKNFIVFNC
jgi:KN motif and ankyrin repeat domain-containing protein